MITINLGGITNKIENLFDTLNNNKIDVALLTETHHIPNNLQQRLNRIGYHMIVNPTQNNSFNGTAILLKHNTTLYYDHSIIKPGRIQKIEFELQNHRYHIICAYLTSGILDEKVQARVEEFALINNAIHSLQSNEEIVILGGDFNMVQSPLDTAYPQHFYRNPDVVACEDLVNSNNLDDTYRRLQPYRKQYTRIVSNSARRIDRIYISNHVNSANYKTYFSATPYSDHCFAQVLALQQSKRFKWGNPHWKINESLLTNENLVEFQSLWEDWRNRKLEFDSALKWWDNGKIKIKQFFIHKGIQQRRRNLNKTADLSKQLQNIHTEIHLSTEQKRNKVAVIKHELKKISNQRINGQKIRGKILQIDNEEEQNTNFFKMEALHGERKQLSELVTENGTQLRTKEEILEEVHNFYRQLWGTKKSINLDHQDQYLDSAFQETEPKIEGHTTLTMEEIEKSRDEQNKNGSPGIDGTTPRFYIWAWEIIKQDLHEVLNNCYLEKQMSESMKTAIVTLIPKKGNTKEIKNWRPVSLLTTDYKILAKIITKRLQEDIKDKISMEQKCALKGRQITDIHLNILATLKHCKTTGNPAILSCYDYSKAFDMLDHSMIFNTLKKMKVKNTTINWISAMYSDIKSKVQVNGALTTEILILRGIRQGCPLSMLLFIIALEAMTRTMKADPTIVSPYMDMKMQQYADDLTTVTADAQSDYAAQEHVQRFCRISGLELNNDKTMKMHINLNNSQYLDLKHHTLEEHIKKEIKILGVTFDNDELIPSQNWDKKVQLAGKALQIHWKRDVSIFGKVKLINTLALSHINYVAKVKRPERRHLMKLNALLFKFLWSPRLIEQCSRKKITKLKELGGLGIPNLQRRCKAIFASRMKGLLGGQPEDNDEPWKRDAIYQLGTRLLRIAPALYSNQRPNADLPDEDHIQILETISQLQEPILNWGEINIKQLYHNLCTRPPENNSTWSLALLENDNIKMYFSNREREISWRTKQNAYKWNSWMYQHGRNINSNCVLCDEHNSDNIEHLLINCPVTTEIWSHCGRLLSMYTTKYFNVDEELIKYNLTDEEENQLEWLTPLKLINIMKVKLLAWRKFLSASNNTLENRSDWIQKMLSETQEDFETFIENFKENHSEEIQDKIHLRRDN